MKDVKFKLRNKEKEKFNWKRGEEGKSNIEIRKEGKEIYRLIN